jgi:hypothetical protein
MKRRDAKNTRESASRCRRRETVPTSEDEEAMTDNEKLELLREFVADVSTWRRGCYAHDRDMGNPFRSFADVEEWKRIESAAKDVLKKVHQ